MTENHGSTIKNDETYEELRKKGYSKEKAARIANAQADPTREPSKKGGEASRYEDRTRDELYRKAAEVGVEGRSDMSKDQLIDALRDR